MELAALHLILAACVQYWQPCVQYWQPCVYKDPSTMPSLGANQSINKCKQVWPRKAPNIELSRVGVSSVK